MRAMAIVLAVTGAALAVPAQAQSGADTVKAKGCLSCHAVDQKKVGPSFKDIAAKYKAGAAGNIVGKLKEGKGHPKVAASDAELKAMVDYVLAQK